MTNILVILSAITYTECHLGFILCDLGSKLHCAKRVTCITKVKLG